VPPPPKSPSPPSQPPRPPSDPPPVGSPPLRFNYRFVVGNSSVLFVLFLACAVMGRTYWRRGVVLRYEQAAKALGGPVGVGQPGPDEEFPNAATSSFGGSKNVVNSCRRKGEQRSLLSK
jgi:hypothetical protein